jgi:thioredoxin 1
LVLNLSVIRCENSNRKNRMKKLILVVLVGISNFVFAQESGIKFEKSNWNQAIQKAKAENKIIFMDAYTSWCGPCKAMQARVFPDKKVGDYFNENFVNIKIDMEQGEGPSLGMKYPVRGYPTLLFIDPKSGKIVNQALGYKSSEQLLQIGEQTQVKKKASI